MGTRGPAPTPSNIRTLKGNGKDRDVASRKVARQPMVVPKAPPMPGDLGPHGERVWKLVAPELVRLGILGQVDASTLEAYCRAYQAWKEMVPGERGWITHTMQMVNIGSKLGLDPAARLRMTLPEVSDDQQDDIFGDRVAG